jgi:hypothetical protein
MNVMYWVHGTLAVDFSFIPNKPLHNPGGFRIERLLSNFTG